MKKILSLLSIIALTLGTAPTATAQYTVMASTDAVENGDQAVRYEYYIENWGGNTSPNGMLYAENTNATGNIFIKRKAQASSGKAIKFIFKKNEDEKFPYSIYTSNIIKSNDVYIEAPVYYETEKNTNNICNIYINGTNENVMKICLSDKLSSSNDGHISVNIYCEGTQKDYYLRWIDKGANGIAVQTNSQDGDATGKAEKDEDNSGNWRVFSFSPAAPAPMIFSKSAKYDGKLYATYSTGVAATIPDGVTAYTATYDATESKLTLSEVSGTTIPVNTGVLLALDASTTNANITVNENGKTVVYPEASTETATLTGTGFEPSCTEDNNTGPFTVGDNTNTETAYILGVGQSHGLGFYKLSDTNRVMDCYKAYLKVSSTSAEAIKLEFPNSTGISAVTTGTKADAPVYDLSGRKVTKTSKGNIYIQNGKKLLAK